MAIFQVNTIIILIIQIKLNYTILLYIFCPDEIYIYLKYQNINVIKVLAIFIS